jgi:hypothetical protein
MHDVDTKMSKWLSVAEMSSKSDHDIVEGTISHQDRQWGLESQKEFS